MVYQSLLENETWYFGVTYYTCTLCVASGHIVPPFRPFLGIKQT